MKKTVQVLFGFASGIVYFFAVGILSVQIIGLQAGAIFDLNNVVVAVTSPKVPVLQMVAVVAVSGLVMFCLTLGNQRTHNQFRVLFGAGFTVAITVSIILTALVAPERGAEGGLPQGVLEGWEGWLQEAAINPAVHVVLLLAIGSLVRGALARNEPQTVIDN
jgi:hypothetical protein